MSACETRIAKIKKCMDNAGGNASGIVTTLKVAAKQHVESIPPADDGTNVISTAITMVADTRPQADIDAGGDPVPGGFHDIDLSEVGLNYTTEEVGEAEDGNIDHVISGFLPKMSAAKNYILEGFRGGAEVDVVFTDRNLVPWLLGNNVVGATVTVTPQTGDRNGYNITIRFRSASLLYSYTAAVPMAA